MKESLKKNIKKLYLKEDLNAKSKSFFLKNPYIKVDNKFISFLKKYSNDNKSCDVRICIHKNAKSEHHDMLLFQRKKNYYAPHKHKFCGDTYHVIQGKLACFLFNEKGDITYHCVVKKNDIFKTPKQVYHVTIPITDVIYHEAKSGPFNARTNSVFPNWTPGTKKEKINFQKKLLKILNV